MTANCPKCGLLKAQGVDAMGLAMAQCVCHFQTSLEHLAQAQSTLHKYDLDAQYKAGWNSAIEMAAYRMQHDFQKSFGKDTLHSIAVWMKEMKK